MKHLSVPVVAALAAFFAFNAHAQDLAPPRLSSPLPEPPATPVATAPPTPIVTPTPAAGAAQVRAASKSTPATERRLSSPRRDILREKPVRAVEERDPATRRPAARTKRARRASQPTFDVSESTWVVAATLRSLENRWEGAVKNHDFEALQELLGPGFVATTVDGREASRSRVLALVRRDKNEYRSAKAQGMQVKSIGKGVSVITGVSTERGVAPGGKKFTVSRDFSDTWKLRDRRWRCIGSRVTKERVR